MSEANIQYIDIPIGGVDTDTADELLMPPKALVCADQVFETGGAIKRRDTFDALNDTTIINGATASTLSAVRAVRSNGAGELVALDRTRLYQYAPGEAKWLESQKATFPVTRFAGQAALSVPTSGAVYVDLASYQGYTAAVYYNTSLGATARVVLIEDATGVQRRVDLVSVPNPAGSVALAASNGSFVLIWLDTTGNIRCSTLQVSNLTAGWSAPTTLTASSGGLTSFDVTDDNGTIYVAFNSAGAQLACIKLAVAAGVVTVATGPISYGVNTNGLSIAIAWADLTKLAIVSCNGVAGVTAREINPTTLAIVGAQWNVNAAVVTANLMTMAGYLDAGVYHGYVAYSTPPTTPGYAITTFFHDTDLVAHTTTAFARPTEPGVCLTHKAFVRGVGTGATWDGHIYVGLGRHGDTDDPQKTFYTYEERGFARYPVAQYTRLTSNILGTPTQLTNRLSAVREISFGQVTRTDLKYRWAGISDGASNSQKLLNAYEFDVSPDVTDHAIAVRGQLLFAASVPQLVQRDVRTAAAPASTDEGALDGLMHLHSPPEPTSLTGAAGGALTALGVYLFKFVYTYSDKAGRKYTSLSSIGKSVTLTAGQQQVTYTMPSFPAPMPGYGTPEIDAYRTLANAAAPLIYYYDKTLVATGVAGTSTQSDAAISVNRILYESSGELPNFPPPPAACVALWKSRILVLDSETGKIWPSKTIIDNEWPGFFEGLAVRTDVHEGLPIWHTPDEDKVIVWWTDAIGVIYGDPANDLGQGGTLQAPIIIPTRGIGLRDRKSVVRTPLGIMFMGDRGIFLLDPALQLTFIGKDVIAYATSNVVGAVLLEPDQRVVFVMNDTLNTHLVYDYNVGQWSTYSSKLNAGALTAACEYNDTLVIANSSGSDNKVWLQTNVGSIDAGGQTPLTVYQTAYLKATGPLGRSRVRRAWFLGTFLNGATRVKVDYDYEGTYLETHTFVGTGNRFEINLIRQECSAVSFRIELNLRTVAMRIEVEAERSALRRAVAVG